MAEYVLLGVGNRLRGDDGAGSILSEKLSNLNSDWVSIDGSVMPENYTSIIKREAPEKLFIVDACDLNKKVGTFNFVDIKSIIEENGFNTHSAPVKIFIDYLKSFVKEIIFIGIQPKNVDFYDTLSPEVEKAINDLIVILKEKQFSKIDYWK